jgi:hypothetical protein
VLQRRVLTARSVLVESGGFGNLLPGRQPLDKLDSFGIDKDLSQSAGFTVVNR